MAEKRRCQTLSEHIAHIMFFGYCPCGKDIRLHPMTAGPEVKRD